MSRQALNLKSTAKVYGTRYAPFIASMELMGARVQEVCDLQIENVHFGPPPIVTITGKGRKTRQVPLWPETATLLRSYCPQNDSLKNVFLNAQGYPLTRFGVRYIVRTRTASAERHCPSLAKKKIGPHTFRHTVDLTVIKNWLGHVNLDTTHAYIEIDLAMKEKALSSHGPASKIVNLKGLIQRNKNLISWLESL